MSRPLQLVLLGLWLGMLVASWVMATVNFRTVDRVLGPGLRPEIGARLAEVPETDRRTVLRHLASETNRWMFRWWSRAQLVLGLVLLVACWGNGGATRGLAAAVLALVLVQVFGLASPIAEVGRSIDFLPRPLPPDVGRRFGLLHAAYVGADFLKGALIAAAAWALARRGV